MVPCQQIWNNRKQKGCKIRQHISDIREDKTQHSMKIKQIVFFVLFIHFFPHSISSSVSSPPFVYSLHSFFGGKLWSFQVVFKDTKNEGRRLRKDPQKVILWPFLTPFRRLRSEIYIRRWMMKMKEDREHEKLKYSENFCLPELWDSLFLRHGRT